MSVGGANPLRSGELDEQQRRRPLPGGARRDCGRLLDAGGSDSTLDRRSMTMLTLAIIKPDAVLAGHAGKILALLEAEGFKLPAPRLVRLTPDHAQPFYAPPP